MVTISIDDETYAGLQARAASAGLTVEDWLRNEGMREERSLSPSEAERRGWRERFDAYLARQKPTNGSLDVSRESIYD